MKKIEEAREKFESMTISELVELYNSSKIYDLATTTKINFFDLLGVFNSVFEHKMKTEGSELDREFLEVLSIAIGKIKEKEKEAISALSEAEDLCNKYGIPYDFSVSRLSQIYQPDTSRWDKLKKDEAKWRTLQEMFDLYEGEYEGWQHSMVC